MKTTTKGRHQRANDQKNRAYNARKVMILPMLIAACVSPRVRTPPKHDIINKSEELKSNNAFKIHFLYIYTQGNLQ